jgi:uncharacterized ferritin-like protein (DUF455 family)
LAADPGPPVAPHAPPVAPPAPAEVPSFGRHRLPTEPAEVVAPSVPRAPSHAPGRIALAAAVVMVAAVAVALAIDAPGRYLEATALALAADALSVAAIVTGIVAIVRNRGRGAGIAALVIAVLGNPLVLLYGLGALA